MAFFPLSVFRVSYNVLLSLFSVVFFYSDNNLYNFFNIWRCLHFEKRRNKRRICERKSPKKGNLLLYEDESWFSVLFISLQKKIFWKPFCRISLFVSTHTKILKKQKTIICNLSLLLSIFVDRTWHGSNSTTNFQTVFDPFKFRWMCASHVRQCAWHTNLAKH